ncbi:hypothetical protein MACH17_18580 [Phaeobacter inhibens]|uniref:hypothetical protein n=1 Tax=Phaeobacter inhibens TaxID=221822 RepID=UPI00274BF8E2|nr:hypothetical protein [Phaeobacter inhibens]GLO70341.1 hypothetical protein MACH17_18580 [Phaeobacter inhibens]
MKLMQHWKHIRPTLAPADEGTPAGDPPAGDPPAGDPQTGGDPAPAQPDFSFIPEQFRGESGPDFEGFQAHYEEMSAAQAIQQEALADVPDDATGYEFAIPDEIDFGDLELPDDFKFQLKTDDPALAPVFEELGGLMHKHNLPKSAAGDLLSVLAKYQATEFSQDFAQSQQEYKALGPTADARISNITRTLAGRLPPDQATALQAAVKSADGVRALEALLLPRGAATSTPTPPEPEQKDPLKARYPTSS